MKCSICKNKIEEIWLGKIKGTYIRKDKKKFVVCKECQTKFKTRDEILGKL